MSQLSHDISVVRELARQYMEIAMSDKHVRMRKRFLDSNDLKIVRPPLIIDEIPWQQMNIDGFLDCVCENSELRSMEYHLRTELFREKYFKCDNYIEPVWPVGKGISNTGNGLKANETSIGAKDTQIRSHHYEDVLEDESSLEAFHLPVITAYPEHDKANLAHVQEILGDTMPAVLRGYTIYYAPWDLIARFRGVEPILMDIYDRPEYLHKIISLFTAGMNAEMDQMEKLGLYDPSGLWLHCTPYPVTINGAPAGASGGNYTCKDVWFRTMAQMFSSISPAAHYEFDMQYSAPLAARCAYTYYGCCEPLDDRIDYLKKTYSNLRKIGCSPWANLERTAEQIGSSYVLSRKPNPANVAIATDPEVVAKEIGDTARVCLKYGCPCDITLKDISTVSGHPENLILWAETASRVLDEYYGEA